jgi:two-component system NarL family sensor kinase
VGALVASRRPENAIGWIFCLLGVSLGAAFSAQFYADYSLIVRPGSLPGGDIAIWSLSWTAPVLSAAPTFVLLLFPDGRLLSRRWRPVAWLAVGAAAMSVVGLAARELVRELGLVRVSSRWRAFERPGRAEWERSER